MKKGSQEMIPTPGYNRRTNVFITLFWPKKHGFIYNAFKKRRSREFKLHLSNLVQYAGRHGIKKRIILFVDHAPCHKAKNVRRLIHSGRKYGIIRMRLLPKRAPKLNPTEWVVNRPLKSMVCTNRAYRDMDELNRNVTEFLRKYRRKLRT